MEVAERLPGVAQLAPEVEPDGGADGDVGFARRGLQEQRAHHGFSVAHDQILPAIAIEVGDGERAARALQRNQQPAALRLREEPVRHEPPARVREVARAVVVIESDVVRASGGKIEIAVTIQIEQRQRARVAGEILDADECSVALVEPDQQRVRTVLVQERRTGRRIPGGQTVPAIRRTAHDQIRPAVAVHVAGDHRIHPEVRFAGTRGDELRILEASGAAADGAVELPRPRAVQQFVFLIAQAGMERDGDGFARAERRDCQQSAAGAVPDRRRAGCERAAHRDAVADVGRVQRRGEADAEEVAGLNSIGWQHHREEPQTAFDDPQRDADGGAGEGAFRETVVEHGFAGDVRGRREGERAVAGELERAHRDVRREHGGFAGSKVVREHAVEHAHGEGRVAEHVVGVGRRCRGGEFDGAGVGAACVGARVAALIERGGGPLARAGHVRTATARHVVVAGRVAKPAVAVGAHRREREVGNRGGAARADRGLHERAVAVVVVIVRADRVVEQRRDAERAGFVAVTADVAGDDGVGDVHLGVAGIADGKDGDGGLADAAGVGGTAGGFVAIEGATVHGDDAFAALLGAVLQRAAAGGDMDLQGAHGDAGQFADVVGQRAVLRGLPHRAEQMAAGNVVGMREFKRDAHRAVAAERAGVKRDDALLDDGLRGLVVAELHGGLGAMVEQTAAASAPDGEVGDDGAVAQGELSAVVVEQAAARGGDDVRGDVAEDEAR